MDPSNIAQLVGSLGFPIVCCGVLFWYIAKNMKEFTDKVTSSLKDLASTVDQNTEATTKLVTTVELLVKLNSSEENVK